MFTPRHCGCLPFVVLEAEVSTTEAALVGNGVTAGVALLERATMAGIDSACCSLEDAAGCDEMGCDGTFPFHMIAVFWRTGCDSLSRQCKVAGRWLKGMEDALRFSHMAMVRRKR